MWWGRRRSAARWFILLEMGRLLTANGAQLLTANGARLMTGGKFPLIWMSVNLPLCGSPPLPALGTLTWQLDSTDSVWKWLTSGTGGSGDGLPPIMDGVFRSEEH